MGSEDAVPSGGGQRTRGGSKPDSMRLLEHRGSPKAASRLSPKTISDSPPGGGRQRSVYIIVERQIKHGPTPGCPGCHWSDDDPKKHSKACRLRFESIYQKGGEGEADAEGPAQSADAGSTAQQGTKR